MPSLTELPSDILFNIFPYLNATDFLSLTSSAKSLLSYSQDPTYWRVLTRRAFRIPPQPLLQADGARWQWLYKNLSTKSRLFTWGSYNKNNLDRVALGRRYNCRQQWPVTVPFPSDIGVIADIQCGPWATYVLNSRGVIYILGSFTEILGPSDDRGSGAAARMLKFPEEYHQTTASRYNPQTAIRQFSAGVSHVLGLSDDGRVWSWESDVGHLVWSSDDEAIPTRKVSRVAAGWERSSAYIYGIGIVHWYPTPRTPGKEIEDTRVNMYIIPGTGYRRKPDDRDPNTLQSRVGEVTNHIVLANYIVFTTDKDKIFCYRVSTRHSMRPEFFVQTGEPIELSTFYLDNPFHIKDLQGSYRSFAVFTDSGSVLTASSILLDSYYNHSSPLPSPDVVPGLQGKSIISIAFGDHHLLALHSYGGISSYGIESQSCGSLGLGGRRISFLRGLLHSKRHVSRGSRLLNGEGRSVWFEPMMNKWLEDMREKMDDGEALERAEMIRKCHKGACVALSDYVEREGRKWEDGITSEGELGAYFVLKVSAGGWSSAALVLVDEEKAEKARRKHIVVSISKDQSPVDQIKEETVAYSARGYAVDLIVRAGRWLLGLTARDAAVRRIAQSSADFCFQQAGDGGRDSDGGMSYTWSNQPFPRLRMADGEVMPGEVSVTD